MSGGKKESYHARHGGDGFAEKEYGMVRLENVLLRTLLFNYAIEKL